MTPPNRFQKSGKLFDGRYCTPAHLTGTTSRPVGGVMTPPYNILLEKEDHYVYC